MIVFISIQFFVRRFWKNIQRILSNKATYNYWWNTITLHKYWRILCRGNTLLVICTDSMQVFSWMSLTDRCKWTSVRPDLLRWPVELPSKCMCGWRPWNSSAPERRSKRNHCILAIRTLCNLKWGKRCLYQTAMPRLIESNSTIHFYVQNATLSFNHCSANIDENRHQQ